MEKFKIKIAIRAIVLAERLLNKPFGKFDFTNENDLVVFVYCIILGNNETRMLLTEFQSVIQTNKKLREELFSEFQAESAKIGQFQEFLNKVKPKNKTDEGDAGYVRDIVLFLVVDGKLDMRYVLEELDLSEIPAYVDAVNNNKRQELENRRLWTFLQMLPHIDSKKIKSPQDLYPFPWETKEMKKQAKKDLRKDKKIFEKIMNGNIKY